MSYRVFSICVASLALVLALQAGIVRAEDVDSCQAVCRDHPDRVKKLFAALNLDHPGMEKVKAAVETQDWPGACEELIAYYRDGDTAKWLRVPTPKPSARRLPGADSILKDTFTFQQVTGVQPRRKDGGLDWLNCEPGKGDGQWATILNRHQWLSAVLAAWRQTGNPDYPRHFDRTMRDWILAHPREGIHAKNGTLWSILQIGVRLEVWPSFFYGFQQADEFTPAGRILMLSSVLDHVDGCAKLSGGSNWDIIGMRGLAGAATCWPEFAESAKWFDRAMGHLSGALHREVYPDGIQREMSFSYHWACVYCFGQAIDYARRLKGQLPDGYEARLQKAWDYIAFALKPDGHNPLTADSDREDFRKRLLAAAETFGREDWRFIATGGKAGTQPDSPPSRCWPRSGQMVMRSGWDADAQWSYFDAGPHGGWHGHYDNLHLSISAFGRDLLVDGGRYWYRDDPWRSYFKSSASHNVILIDGQGQNNVSGGVGLSPRYAICERFDFARGDHGAGFGSINGVHHSRAVVYLREIGWVVFDHIKLDQPGDIQALWHFHPDCTVKADGLSVASIDEGRGNLRIIPAGGPDWKLSIVKGQEKPAIQGWYSPTYNIKHANATAVYEAKLSRNATFAWLLLPAKGAVPRLEVESLPAPAGAARVRFKLPGEKTYEVAVRLQGKQPVPVTGNLQLDGDCAIIGLAAKPLVAGGRISSDDDNIVTEHDYGP